MFKWLFNKFKYLQVEQNLKRQNQSLQLLEAITLKICQSLNLEDILQTAVTEVRKFLRCDRLLVYRLWLDGTGSAVAESVDPKYLPILGQTFPSEVFPVEIHQHYCQGHIKAIGDIKQASISRCLIEFLQQFNVKAKLVVPILFQSKLWGLLIAHQCQKPRQWSTFEIELLQQLANRLSIAVSQAELVEALRLSEDRYALAMQASNDGLWDWDLKTDRVYFSPRWKALLGYGESEIGSSIEEWWNRLHPQAQAQIKAQMTEYLASQTRHDFSTQFISEHQIQHRDGTYRWVLVRGLPKRGSDGKIERIVGSLSDITGRKQAEHQLHLLESVVVNANDAVVITEAEPINEPGPRILYVNQAFSRMTGYSAEEVLGKTPRILQGPKTDRANCAKIRAALKAWQPVRAEFINYCKDGSEFWVELNIAPVADKTGWYTHWIAIQREITERKRAEDAFGQQTKREQLVAQIAQRIRRSLQLSDILNTTVTEVRQFLGCDRVLIYRLWTDGTGSAVTEAVAPCWQPILGRTFPAEVFPVEYRDLYKQGRTRAIANVETETITPCLVEFLHELQVKAKLVVSLMQGDALWGLLIAHHCTESRAWQPFEVDLLASLATQLAIAIQQAELYDRLQEANQELEHLAKLDSLTGVANRRRFDEYLDQIWLQMAGEHKLLSLVLCDIDCFKLYNDTYGHQAGDHCIQQVAKAISRAVERPTDLVARYGGEEFAVILTNTGVEGAVSVAEKIRAEVEALKIVHATSGIGEYVTLSLGVASTMPASTSSIAMLVALADEALYQAKKRGRNQVIVYSPPVRGCGNK
ncbi:diguanylate cyclase [Planktothrix sp. FACHB-1355]|uniref:Diguanylate cyclase n=1 Tax=Aerosakkonema funiforme FACHB-1375 TaxID=2949571 RepID=A0A926VHH1_9CYAN|nr:MULTISPECIES: diguanylate cyclase [Oscillatoriales]MBD2182802.1 diguanylate cyclase [Aerosakkonema funiforme FACHB-1375]MBD3558022.1 diguanylate cyclase [Planktothrix sp. FACHB-1355]